MNEWGANLFFVETIMPNDTISILFQVVPSCVVLLIILVVTVFVLRLIRANMSKTELRPEDYLKSFQKLREDGKLTEEEFRIVRGLLSLQLIRNSNESKDYSLLNKISPQRPVDRPSGNIPKD